jgi:hypothetical protein
MLAAKTSGAYTNSAITGTDAGSYSQTLTLNSNYQWSSGSNVTSNRTKTCTISAKSVAVTWGTTTSFAYTGSAQAPTASATSGVSGETINVTRTTQTNVGSYTSTASCSSVSGGQAKCSNYTLTGTTKAYSITEVAATCPTLTAYNKAYDGSAHGITVSGGSGGTIQYRTSTINISPIGRDCTLEERKLFIEYDKKNHILDNFKLAFDNEFGKKYNVSTDIGGQISFDVFPKGWDKRYCLQFLKDYDNIIFFGDKTYVGGSDYEIGVSEQITQGYNVINPEETIEKIKNVLKEIEEIEK